MRVVAGNHSVFGVHRQHHNQQQQNDQFSFRSRFGSLRNSRAAVQHLRQRQQQASLWRRKPISAYIFEALDLVFEAVTASHLLSASTG